MASDLVVADWAPIFDEEVRQLFKRLPESRGVEPELIGVTWTSPRPMSAAALVSCATVEYFVKRHHTMVRSVERLHVEHALARHLRERGLPVARVLGDVDGSTALLDGDVVYEVHEKAIGVDLYRDVASWYPFLSTGHAHAAGSALARFHEAAADFPAPASPPDILTDSMVIMASSDVPTAFRHLVEARPALARALAGRDFDADVARDLVPFLESAAPLLQRLDSQWTHGDWHPSNLTWSSRDFDASVAGILDLGLANRTIAVRDIALAIERSAIDWLRTRGVHVVADFAVVDALLDGYETERPLSSEERTALTALLPVTHVEFALSEIEYFSNVVHSPDNTDLAYNGYLLGHARWFAHGEGSELLEHLARRR